MKDAQADPAVVGAAVVVVASMVVAAAVVVAADVVAACLLCLDVELDVEFVELTMVAMTELSVIRPFTLAFSSAAAAMLVFPCVRAAVTFSSVFAGEQAEIAFVTSSSADLQVEKVFVQFFLAFVVSLL